MTASDHLGRQFVHYDMSPYRHLSEDKHGNPRWLGEPNAVRAFAPGADVKSATAEQHGFLRLTHDGSTVDEIWVHPDHRRQGLGTAMVKFAQEKEGRPLLPSGERSDAGDAFARKLGAPPRDRVQKWHGIGMYAP